jgi:hypothetical protein
LEEAFHRQGAAAEGAIPGAGVGTHRLIVELLAVAFSCWLSTT